MRKLFVSADIEGCGAVASQHALLPDRWEWAAARRWMTEDVIAVAQAAFAAGYRQVIVADSHGNAHNIDPDLLPDNVQLIRSWPRPLHMMQGVEQDGVEACAFVGYHGGSMTQGALLGHTFSGAACRNMKLNGIACSEGFINAALAGEFGQPVVFVSGDNYTVADAQRYAPEAVGFVTKQAMGYRSEAALPPGQVRRMLAERVKEALNRPLPRPFLLPGPFRLEIEMTTQVAAEMLAYLPNIERSDAWTVGADFERIETAMRFIAFVTRYSPSGTFAY
jgi:D-amino peptidase